jgi:hypothetical protein
VLRGEKTIRMHYANWCGFSLSSSSPDAELTLLSTQ